MAGQCVGSFSSTLQIVTVKICIYVYIPLSVNFSCKQFQNISKFHKNDSTYSQLEVNLHSDSKVLCVWRTLGTCFETLSNSPGLYLTGPTLQAPFKTDGNKKILMKIRGR